MFAAIGAVIAGVAGYHYKTGIPLWQSNGKYSSGGEHIADNSELLFDAAGGAALFLFGAFLTIAVRNIRTVIDDEGIYATNAFRKKVFKASWSELTSLKQENPQAKAEHTLRAGGQQLQIGTSMQNYRDLLAEIRQRAPLLK